MNDLIEVNFQNEIIKIKDLLRNPAASSREINNEWSAVIQRNSKYNVGMFLGFLELFRLCATPNSTGNVRGPRDDIAKSIWGSIEEDYLTTSKFVSADDRIKDFSMVIGIPGALKIASKMLEKDELQAALLNLERGSEKPLKKSILKKLLSVSKQGPILLEFIRVVQDQDLLEEVIKELKENRKKHNLDESSPDIKFLEVRLIPRNTQSQQSSYAETQAKLSNNKRKMSDEVISSPVGLDDFSNDNNSQKFFKSADQDIRPIVSNIDHLDQQSDQISPGESAGQDIRAIFDYINSLEQPGDRGSLVDKNFGNGW